MTFGRSLIVSALLSGDHSQEVASCGHDGQLLVDVEKLVAQRREHDPPDERAREGRVEDVGILGETEAQRLAERGRAGERSRQGECGEEAGIARSEVHADFSVGRRVGGGRGNRGPARAENAADQNSISPGPG